MNREEIITKIQDEICKIQDECQIDDLAHKLIDEIFDDVEKLRKPITLAELLGLKKKDLVDRIRKFEEER